MEKEFEALEYFADTYKEFLKGKDTHCQITLTREQATEFVKEVKDVYQALTELKAIKEAKPSEAFGNISRGLETIENDLIALAKLGVNETFDDLLYDLLLDIGKTTQLIKKDLQALLDAQEQEKVLEIIKEKPQAELSLIQLGKIKTYEEYLDRTQQWEGIYWDMIYTEDEFNLLKRWSEK